MIPLIFALVTTVLWFVIPVAIVTTQATPTAISLGALLFVWSLYNFLQPSKRFVGKTISLIETTNAVATSLAKYGYTTSVAKTIARAILLSSNAGAHLWNFCIVLTLVQAEKSSIIPWTYLGYAALVVASLKVISAVYEHIKLERGDEIIITEQRMLRYVASKTALIITTTYLGYAILSWVLG